MSRALVRPAAPEDAQAILELWRLAGAFPTRTDAEEEGEPVGTRVAAFDGWRGTLFRLAVLPTHRRRGVARALVAKGERSLRERGAIRVNLYAIRAETEALEFWSAVGYARDEWTCRFVKNLEP